mmetsp:Transcript_26318/g.80986  ORF Transcript_26318/g.80986 Transcript_26318/m.80986 type:complete len:556 (+) Transcript_26318:809-2476(+)
MCFSKHGFSCASRCVASSSALATSLPANVMVARPPSWSSATVASSESVYVIASSVAWRKRPMSRPNKSFVARRSTSRPSPPASRPGSPANLKKKGQRHCASLSDPSSLAHVSRTQPRWTSQEMRPARQCVRRALRRRRNSPTRRRVGQRSARPSASRSSAFASATSKPSRASANSKPPSGRRRRTYRRWSASAQVAQPIRGSSAARGGPTSSHAKRRPSWGRGAPSIETPRASGCDARLPAKAASEPRFDWIDALSSQRTMRGSSDTRSSSWNEMLRVDPSRAPPSSWPRTRAASARRGRSSSSLVSWEPGRHENARFLGLASFFLDQTHHAATTRHAPRTAAAPARTYVRSYASDFFEEPFFFDGASSPLASMDLFPSTDAPTNDRASPFRASNAAANVPSASASSNRSRPSPASENSVNWIRAESSACNRRRRRMGSAVACFAEVPGNASATTVSKVGAAPGSRPKAWGVTPARTTYGKSRLNVGTGVGFGDGSAVGSALGSGVGVSVGIGLGSAVGSGVGWDDGSGLGALDGCCVGRAVGCRVGARVGRGDG